MNLRKISVLVFVIGISLIIISTSYLVYEEQTIKEYGGNVYIDPYKAYETCIYLRRSYNVTITIRSNGTYTFIFYNTNTGEIIKNLTINNYFFNSRNTIEYDDEYCILFANNNSKIIKISYDLLIIFKAITEKYPFITLTGISFIIGSIFLFYFSLINRQKEYPSVIETKDIICKSKSLNKHECIINIDHSFNPNIVIEYFVKSLGYKVRRKLKEKIIELSYKGRFMSKRFSQKSRTVIVFLEKKKIILNYILSPLNANGSIDLKDIFEEITRLKDFISSKNQ